MKPVLGKRFTGAAMFRVNKMFHEETLMTMLKEHPTVHVIIETTSSWINDFLEIKAKDPRSFYLHSGLKERDTAGLDHLRRRYPASKQYRESLARHATASARRESVVKSIKSFKHHSAILRIYAGCKSRYDTHEEVHLMLVGEGQLAQFCRDVVLAPKLPGPCTSLRVSLLDERANGLESGLVMFAPMRKYWWSLKQFKETKIMRHPKFTDRRLCEYRDPELVGPPGARYTILRGNPPWASKEDMLNSLSASIRSAQLAGIKGNLEEAIRLGIEQHDLLDTSCMYESLACLARPDAEGEVIESLLMENLITTTGWLVELARANRKSSGYHARLCIFLLSSDGFRRAYNLKNDVVTSGLQGTPKLHWKVAKLTAREVTAHEILRPRENK
jgi:hypothetical protein